jgi:hypothetical protein
VATHHRTQMSELDESALESFYTISEITPYLYLSGYDCLTESKLAALSVTCVVDAMNSFTEPWNNTIHYVRVSSLE